MNAARARLMRCPRLKPSLTANCTLRSFTDSGMIALQILYGHTKQAIIVEYGYLTVTSCAQQTAYLIRIVVVVCVYAGIFHGFAAHSATSILVKVHLFVLFRRKTKLLL